MLSWTLEWFSAEQTQHPQRPWGKEPPTPLRGTAQSQHLQGLWAARNERSVKVNMAQGEARCSLPGRTAALASESRRSGPPSPSSQLIGRRERPWAKLSWARPEQERLGQVTQDWQA